jgi:UDP-N-acetylmuramate dehydrogenase
MQFIEGKNLSELTTFGIGGPARYFTEVETVSQLQQVVAYCYQTKSRYFVLGKGSNVLFDDRGFNGLVILNKICFCEQTEGLFHVGAGYSFSLLGVQTARKGLMGLEFASGIPGSVGGAVYMNAGASGGETFQTLTEVTFVDEQGNVCVETKEKLKWGYRSSSFQETKSVIAAARFQLQPNPEARKKQLTIVNYRTKTQPYSAMSAGCLFRNPSQKAAGALIEQCGLKGYTLGGAQVSSLHGNFIINTGSATALDILSLARYVQTTVKAKTGIELEMEVRPVDF